MVCQFCLKNAKKSFNHLPGLRVRPGPADSTHLWTSTHCAKPCFVQRNAQYLGTAYESHPRVRHLVRRADRLADQARLSEDNISEKSPEKPEEAA